jgi:hypothetical protein
MLKKGCEQLQATHLAIYWKLSITPAADGFMIS